MAVKWVWAFESHNNFDSDSNIETLNQILTNYESILYNHSWKCETEKCQCRKGKTLKLL